MGNTPPPAPALGQTEVTPQMEALSLTLIELAKEMEKRQEFINESDARIAGLVANAGPRIAQTAAACGRDEGKKTLLRQRIQSIVEKDPVIGRILMTICNQFITSRSSE